MIYRASLSLETLFLILLLYRPLHLNLKYLIPDTGNAVYVLVTSNVPINYSTP